MAVSLSFGACFLLLVCLTNMVTAEGQALQLLNTQRMESADNTTFTFTAQFKANKKPTADWWEIHESTGNNILTRSTLTYDERSKEGTTSITVTKEGHRARVRYLNIGDRGSHYFHLLWKTTGEGNLSMDVNWPASRVTPGTDVPYSAGNLTPVIIQVNQNGSNDVTDRYAGRMFLFETLYHNSTANAVQGGDHREFVKTEMSKQDGQVVNTLTFYANETTFNGILKGVIYTLVNQTAEPVTWCFEIIVLRLHEDQYAGPFPDGQVYAKWVAEKTGCAVDSVYPCGFTCRAFGNNLDSMQIYKLDDDSTRTPVETQSLLLSTRYDWQTYFTLNTTQDFGGTYVCQVMGNNGTVETELRQNIVKIEQGAKVQAFTNKTLDDGTMELTCTAEGSGPLMVWLGMPTVDPLQAGRGGVVSYSAAAPSVEGSNHTVTVVAVVNTSSPTYHCVATNRGKQDDWAFL
ncbi:hypothetical protein V1264_016428 [Littorina saxatilis]|uniref:Ig-like domain-containing protein n=2 Tax=Littorina saxatilis TaxID=31220 RepID=A0AAN9GHK9_9CAEN